MTFQTYIMWRIGEGWIYYYRFIAINIYFINSETTLQKHFLRAWIFSAPALLWQVRRLDVLSMRSHTEWWLCFYLFSDYYLHLHMFSNSEQTTLQCNFCWTAPITRRILICWPQIWDYSGLHLENDFWWVEKYSSPPSQESYSTFLKMFLK